MGRLEMDSVEISNTIFAQLKGLGMNALMGWGSRKFTMVEHGLKFQINTPRISFGWVEIILDEPSDTYNLNFYNSRLRKLNSVKGIYFDELISTIDENIESKEFRKMIVRD